MECTEARMVEKAAQCLVNVNVNVNACTHLEDSVEAEFCTRPCLDGPVIYVHACWQMLLQ
jgi:hypothetical protein